MKSGFLTLLASALCAGGLRAAPAPIYINDIPVNAAGADIPIIDARAWVNQSVFNVYNDAGTLRLPYRSQHTFYFTNLIGASMFGVPGFQFILDRKGIHYPMDTWVNEGSISVDWTASVLGSSSLGVSETSALLVRATNIFNTGPLSVGTKGAMRLEGRNVNVRRSGLRSGPPAPSSFLLPSLWIGGGVHYNDYGVSDLYWGLGNGNVLQGGGNVNIDGPQGLRDPYFQMPYPQSPTHQVLTAPWMPDLYGFCGSTTNEVSLPDLTYYYYSFFGSTNGYASLTYTYRPTPTNTVVQVVFYPTNTPDSAFSNSVAFDTWTSDGRARVYVGFHNTEFDIVWRSNVTYSIYLVDNLMVAQSNVNYSANGSFLGMNRPNTYSVFRGGPDDFSFGFAGGLVDPVFDPTLIYNPNYTAKAVPMSYTAYGARVEGYIAPSPAFRLPCATNSFLDSSNYLGRVDIIGDDVNLNRTRIRAESSLVVKSPNLINNQLAEVNAPFVNFEVASLKPSLTISNLAPATVRRINGEIHAWSGIWDNTFTNATTTNNYRFHVLFIDHNLRGEMPVTTEQFSAKAGSLTISDPLQIGRYFRADASNLTVTASGGVALPSGNSVGASNLVNVRNFTNQGFLYVPRGAHFGDDRLGADGQPQPYLNFVNSGTVASGTLFVKSDRLFNSGLLWANGGVISIDTLRTRLLGGPTVIVTNQFTNIFCDVFFNCTNAVVTTLVTNTSAAQINGNAIVEINARNLLASNSLIQAGKLILSVTNDLTAGDLGALSTWFTAGGVEMRRRPTNSSSLMAVTLVSQPSVPFQPVRHVWSAKNLGATRSGFNNNLALGRLILDGRENSIFQFFGTRTNKALYVDYLELQNYATNFFGGDQALRIDPSITVYFANANIAPEKLTNSFRGRLQWVANFTGPFSSTNIVNFCTNADSSVTPCTYAMNVALATSKDIDSDNDGLVNAEDLDPLNRCPCAQPAPLAAGGTFHGAGATMLQPGSLVLAPPPIGRLRIAPEQRAAPSQVVLSWDSLAGANNVVEFTTTLSSASWQVLTNFSTGPLDRRLTVSDEVLADGQRFYRVRVLPPAP